MRCLVPLLLLVGCHVLDDGAIETTCEDLGTCAEGGGLFSGLALVLEEDSGPSVLLLDKDLETMLDLDLDLDPDTPVQSVAYNPVSNQLSIALQDRLRQYTSEGAEAASFLLASGAPLQLLQQGGEVFLLFAEGGQTWVESLGVGTTASFLEPGDFSQIMVLGRGGEDEIFVADWTVSGHLWSVDISDLEAPRLTSLFAQYDTEEARSSILFPGPGGAPHTCSAAGAMYAVSDLFDGVAAPVRIPGDPLSDVVACAYEPLDDQLVVVSATEGVILVNAGNSSEVAVSLPEGARVQAAASW
jgi:hypothetical protein